MRYCNILATGCLAMLGVFSHASALAGPYGDDMAKCLVRSTTEADRTLFVRWLFASMALHPDVESMALVSSEQREVLNKDAGALFQKLLTESCRSETQQALKYEGAPTIQAAFTVFGQAAGPPRSVRVEQEVRPHATSAGALRQAKPE